MFEETRQAAGREVLTDVVVRYNDRADKKNEDKQDPGHEPACADHDGQR